MTNPYSPISDYAAIGNLRTVALVNLSGSIDWCCFPNLEDPSVFAAILDAEKGGHFSISPDSTRHVTQKYIEGTNVLRTTFECETGELQLTDFMPLASDELGSGKAKAGQEIHRLLKCITGSVSVRVEWAPRFNYAKSIINMEEVDGNWVASCKDASMSLLGLLGTEPAKVADDPFGPVMKGTLNLSKGNKKAVVTRWNIKNAACSVALTEKLLSATIKKWRNWLYQEELDNAKQWAGPWYPMVVRSMLALKLLKHIDTGAIAAAPTTSLPEWIGGNMNWDYRYSWIRDASLTAQALASLGHVDEALELLDWTTQIRKNHFQQKKTIQIMYGLNGETNLQERFLDYLSGYKNSKPVRVGNRAYNQTQHDIFGELFNTAHELLRHGVTLESEVYSFLSQLADYCCSVWKQPDFGIWELTGQKRHYVHSKVMLWAALDRAVQLAYHYNLKGDVDKWILNRNRIYEEVLNRGFNSELGSFVQAYDSKYLDAATLRIPILGFLPASDYRVQGTINQVMKTLMVNGVLYRNNTPTEKPTAQDTDNLPRQEGAFCLCTFWLIDALALSNRVEEAKKIFNNMISHTNQVGLLSEEINPLDGSMLGNFPQGFTHIGIITSALYIAYAEGKEIPDAAILGTKQHKEEIEGRRPPPFKRSSG